MMFELITLIDEANPKLSEIFGLNLIKSAHHTEFDEIICNDSLDFFMVH